VSNPERGERTTQVSGSAVHLYCLGALVAEEATRGGFPEFARSLEAALGGLLSRLPRDEQGAALRLAYQLAIGSEEAAQPRLRLVFSRD
jgi:hypothetical protein